jgi:hypothetical protein
VQEAKTTQNKPAQAILRENTSFGTVERGEPRFIPPQLALCLIADKHGQLRWIAILNPQTPAEAARVGLD